MPDAVPPRTAPLYVWIVLAHLYGCASAPTPAADFEQPVYGAEPFEAERPKGGQSTKVEDRSVDREGTGHEYDALVPLMKRAESIRGLPFLRRFELRVQDPKTLQKSVMDATERSQTERYLHMLTGLGLTEEEAQEQRDKKAFDVPLEGYYDFYRKRLVLKEEVALGLLTLSDRESRLNWRSVILHELVHVLQDQHFDITAQFANRTGFDQRQGFMALMEGDAMLVSLDYAITAFGVSFDSVINKTNLLEQLLGGENTARYGAGALGNSALLNPLVFRYYGGALFVAAVVRRQGWDGVDRRFRVGQVSTHEVLSPDDLDGFSGCDAHLPEAALRKLGYEPTQKETVGRLFLASYLGMGGAMADFVAAGWRCDRLGVWDDGDKVGAAWVVGFDSPDIAQQAAQMAHTTLVRTEPPVKDGAKPGYIAFADGNYMLLLRHVRGQAHKSIEAAFRGRPGS